MKVVIHSPAFPPQIGGLEEIARICAAGLTELGHQVTVLCESANNPPMEFPFRVLREASWRERLAATAACDVFLMFNMSLKGLPLPLLCRKPLVICHQGWYGRNRNDHSFRSRLKCWLSLTLAKNIACSRAVASYLGGPVAVIPNAYNDQLFRLRPEIPRARDVLFVGRLVSDKGCDLLVNALAQLAADGVRPTMTITGSGPEEESLKQQVVKLGLADQTQFTGALRGEALARMMNSHRILVVPSIWEEPFGIVALEGIASGCWVIGSKRGGLAEAIGPCGTVFENASQDELTAALKTSLITLEEVPKLTELSRTHLEDHSPARVVLAYDAELKTICPCLKNYA
jgi:glycosyltransferase involved in cell wall biosynthesis